MDRKLMRRAEVPAYAQDRHGVPVAAKTLAKLASVGGGPRITYFGSIPMYAPDDVDEWVRGRLSAPVASTAERSAA